MKIQTLELPHQTLYFIGPQLEEGVVPTLFYFSISGKDSLLLDPFNQPAVIWYQKKMRIFSVDLPFHSDQENPHHALDKWADSFLSGENPFSSFIENTLSSLSYLRKHQLIDQRLGFAGLSRGVFFAAHLMARIQEVKYLLGFAPLTSLKLTKEFTKDARLENLIASLDLIDLSEELFSKTVRFYIGNYDMRVSTKHCFLTLQAFTQKAKEKGISSPPMEMIIYPSIGKEGHGTPFPIFKQGALWMAEKMGIS